MQTTIRMTGLAVSLVCLTLCAQEARRPASASTGISTADVESYFRRMDISGDGKLSRAEVDGYPTLKNGFDSFDSNGDGGISLDEMQTVTAQWRQSQRQNPPTAPPQTAAAPKRSFAGTGNATDRGDRYLVLISIDGCRRDYLTFTDTPNIRTLISAGTSYDEAWAGQLRNDTPPGHVTISMGAFPARHGVIGFHWQNPATGAQFKPTTWFGVGRGQLNDLLAKSGCGSLGSIYKQAHPGAKVAAFSSDKFYAAAALGADSADFIGYCRYETAKGFGTAVGQKLSPETVTGRQVPVEIMSSPELQRKVANPWDGDSWTVDFALQLFAKEKPEILLLNLALCDDIGHTHGANLGREQVAGIIANADRQIGRLMQAYRQAGIYDKTIFVITSDHGTVTWDNQHIPLIIAGPGIRKDATSHAPARLVDIAPTVLAAMGLAPENMEGVVLADALVSPADGLARAQQAVNERLTPLKDALQKRHAQDMATQPIAKQEPAVPTGPSKRGDRNERWPIAGEGNTAAAGGAQQYFQQLDRDGDGKVGKEEAGSAPWFDRVDRNKDGVITRDELGQVAPASPWRPAGGPSKTETPSADKPTSQGMKRAFRFTRDYTAGTKDANGQMRTGQELMNIKAYRGKLFAATSAFTDPRLYIESDPDYTGCQVLRKSGANAEWQVEASLGKRYLRADYLEVVRFTKDADGKVLPEPIEMLVATVWDLGEIVRDSRITGRDRRLTLAVRDDATGNWTLVPGPGVPDSERGFACIRSLKVHTDKVTGMEYLFVAAGCGGMYKSVFDPAVPGRIRWLEGDELDKSYGRGQSMCVANGDLYVSYDYGGLLVQNQAGGVFRRIDGPAARWERVYRNYDPKYATWNQTGRGITAVPAEDGSGKEVLLVGIENPPEPIIVRIESHHGHRAVTELNYNEYFTGVFGRKPQMLGGSAQHPHAGNEIPALNRFDPFINPETGKTERFVTLFLFHPDDPAEGCNHAYFLIRRAPGEYDWGEVTSDLPPGESLRGVRTIEKSPFPEEPNTYYFGGFFTGPDVQPPRPNLAWIFKGVVGKRERGTVKTAPPAEVVTPALYEDAEHGFSFQYPGNMRRTKPGVMTMANAREAPTVLVNTVAAQTVREAALPAFRAALGAPELIDYTECSLYLGSSTGVAGNLTPGGRVGKRFTCRYLPGNDRPALAAVGMGWTEGNHTTLIAVSYWGAYTEGLANVLLNKIIVSLKIERGVGQGQRVGGAATPTPRAGADQFEALLQSLDTNRDGRITKEEAGGAAWFGRVDQNNDGVLDAGELETARRASGAWAGGGGAPKPGTPAQGGDQIIERIKSLDTNGDGRITKEEAAGAAWFGRADQNNDGVIDAAELEALQRGTGARRGAINR